MSRMKCCFSAFASIHVIAAGVSLISFVANCRPAAAQAISGHSIGPATYGVSESYGGSGQTSVGFAEDVTATTTYSHALIWTSPTTTSSHDLNPSGFNDTYATGYSTSSGGITIGDGDGSTTSYAEHALYWTYSPTTGYTDTDINPTNYNDSVTTGISGTTIVGYGDGTSTTNGYYNALLWNGTPGSYTAVNINPSGYTSSEALGVTTTGSSVFTAGYAATTGQTTSAVIWTGKTGSTAVIVNPTGDATSEATAIFSSGTGVGQTMAVGYGATSATSPSYNAVRWLSTGATTFSSANLVSTGFTDTYATGVYGNLIVGHGDGTSTGNATHALLWMGTNNATLVDLTSYLPSSFTSTYTDTYATGVDAFGDVFGYGTSANGAIAQAFYITVTPEPNALALLAASALPALGLSRLRRRTGRLRAATGQVSITS